MRIVTPGQFGALGDGIHNDTIPLLSWRDAILSGRIGYLKKGIYKLDEGELIFYNKEDNSNGPTIITDGSHNSILMASGKNDAPIMEIRNNTPGRFLHDTRINGIGFIDTSNDDAPNRCGISISGLAYGKFGYMRGDGLKGDLVLIPNRHISGNPDPFHVFACKFQGIEAVRCAGWALNNDNGVGFNGCDVHHVISSSGLKGGIRSGGAGNTYHVISVGDTKGWAVERYSVQGTVSREKYDMLEIDGTENGIYMNNISFFEVSRARVIYRWLPGHNEYWPRTGLKIGGLGSATLNGKIDIIHRIDPGGDKDGLGLLHDFSNDPNVSYICIDAWIEDHPGFSLIPPIIGPPILDFNSPLSKISMKVNGEVFIKP